MTDVLDHRRLNGATLARQHLLERASLPTIAAVEHLGGVLGEPTPTSCCASRDALTQVVRGIDSLSSPATSS